MPFGRRTLKSWLVPYLEGTLDERRVSILTERLAHDPALAAEADALRSVVGLLYQSAQARSADADPRLALEPSPLWPGIEARLTPPRRPFRTTLAWAGGLCAALLLIGGFWLRGIETGPGTLQTGPLTVTHLASGPSSSNMVTRTGHSKRHHVRLRPKSLLAQGRGHAIPLKPTHAFAAEKSAPSPGDSKYELPDANITPNASVTRPAVSISDGEPHFRLASPVVNDHAGQERKSHPRLAPKVSPHPGPPAPSVASA